MTVQQLHEFNLRTKGTVVNKLLIRQLRDAHVASSVRLNALV
jgi:hypothetical protein